MLFSYPEVLHRSFGSSITLVLDETHWHRINAEVASHVFSLLASVEGTTFCLEIPLQSPPPPPRDRHLATVSPPPSGRPSRANPGVCKGGAGTLCGCPSHPEVASTKILAESEAPRWSCDFCPFHACLLLACLLLAKLLGPPQTLKRVIKPRLVPPAR